MDDRNDRGVTFGAARLLAGAAALVVLAVAFAALAGSARADDPEPDVELRVWQSVAEPLRLWVSARPDDAASWRTAELGMAIIEGGGWRAGDLTVRARNGHIELRVWQDPSALETLHLSARPAGASWAEYGTQPLTLDQTSKNDRYTYADLTVALAADDAEPPAPPPAAAPPALCIPDDLETETIEGRVWRSVAQPDRYWVSTRPDEDSRWVTRARTIGVAGDDGWRTLGVSADAGEAAFELRVWRKDAAHHLSARVAGATWLEYGTQALDLPTTSRNRRYTYGDIEITLTLPEAEPPLPGETAATWDCPDAGAAATPTPAAVGGFPIGGVPPTSPGGQTNDPPTADAGPDQHAARGATVTLDGSGSTDPERGPLTYSWSMTSEGTYDGSTSILPGNTVNPTFTMPSDADIGETLIFRLTVRDNGGKTDTDKVKITTNTPPTVEAGAAQTVLRDATVNLSGTVTESDPGQTVSYQWTKTGGTYTGQITLTGDTTETASFTMPKAAKHDETVILTLTATDSLGGVGKDTVTVTAQNRPPTGAEAGTGANAARGSTVTLAACPAGATDPDGDTLTCSWAKTGGTYTEAITITTTTPPSFVMPTGAAIDETVILTLTVSDGHGGSVTDAVTYTAINATPTADAGDDASADRASTVTLDGSGSSDADGTLSYAWSQTAGTPNVTLSSTTVHSPTFAMPSRGTGSAGAHVGEVFTFRLTVTDAENVTDTDTVDITAANARPTANAGSDVSATAGVAAQLNATATDPDGSTFTWQWDAAPSAANDQFSDRTIANPTFTPNATDAINTVYTLMVTAQDEDSGSGSDTLILTVTNRPPTASAGADQDVNQSTAVTLSGSGSDPDGHTLSYSWSQTAGTTVALSNTTAQSPTFTSPNLTGLTSEVQFETLTFSLTVSDGNGGTATDTVDVIVRNAGPTANVGANRGATAGQNASLNANANDPDGSNSALTYSWSVTKSSGAPAATLSGATTATPTLVVPSGAYKASPHHTYTVRVTVTDEDAATASDSAVLTVNNRPPVADARASSAYALHPNKVYLNGLSSRDPDHNPLTDPVPAWTWSWAKTGGTYTGPITINHATTSSANFAVPYAASIGDTIIITLTLGDGDGGTDTDSVTINVNAAPQDSNKPPVANPGAAYQYFRMTAANKDNPTVSLDASGSSDPDGDELYYRWSQYAGTCKTSITLANDRNAQTSFQWPSGCGVGGSIGLRLTVYDRAGAGGLSDTEYIQVWRRDGVPVVTITGGARTEYKRSDSTSRSFTVSGTVGEDPDGDTITSYEWDLNKAGWTGTKPCPTPSEPNKTCPDPTILPAGFSISPTGSQTTLGSLTVTLGSAVVPATDYSITLRGGSGYATVNLTVANNTAPSVKINNQSGTQSKDITGATWWREYRQSTTITDAENHTYTCSWSVSPGGGSNAMAFTDGGAGNCNPKIEIRETNPGDYTITLTVTDSIGDTQTATMTINVV